jgi:LysM repeat protein
LGPATLRVEPSVILGLPAGETRHVQVRLDNVEGLQSIEVHIGFEPRYVQIEDADPDGEGLQVEIGDFPVPAQVVRNEADNYGGSIIYEVSAGEPVSGSGIVASFTLRGQAEGGSPLRFTIVKLHDAEGQELVLDEEIDGLVSVGPGSAAPTEAPSTEAPSTEASPTPMPPASTPTPVPPTPVPTTAPSTGSVYHTVQAGENLYRISLRYGTTVSAIVAANNLPNANSIYVGQVLLIPGSGQGQPSSGGTTYVVQPGDTLYSIARRYGTTVAALAAHNGIVPPYTIKVGQTLRIP